MPSARRKTSANTNLYILVLFFIAGALIGCLFARMVSGNGYDYMESIIGGFIESAGGGDLAVRLLDSFTSAVKLPFLVFLLGMSNYGTYIIPFVFSIRGFMLAFTCTAFVRLLALPGLLCAASLFLPTCIISIPAMLFMGVQAVSSQKRDYYQRAIFCLVLLIISALVEAFITPKLLVFVISRFGIL